jgi:hypothetical protein
MPNDPPMTYDTRKPNGETVGGYDFVIGEGGLRPSLVIGGSFGIGHSDRRHSRRNLTPCSMSSNRSCWVPTSRSMHSGPR